MISEKAVEAAAIAMGKLDHQCGDSDAVFMSWFPTSADMPEYVKAARAALSAALPVLLEGKREEIAREVDPNAWAFADRHKNNPAMATEVKNEVYSSLCRADRIISIMGGGE